MKIFDSLSRKKSQFLFKDNIIKIFICGPTVYDYCHLGHARIFFFYDLMTRYLLFKGLEPMVIVNLTDIDPKIATRANIQGLSPEALANKYIDELYTDLLSCGITTTFNFVRVSDYVKTAAKLVVSLLERKLAYSRNGNIYLDTTALRSYGKLSQLSVKDLDNRRLDIGPGKLNPRDILIWNASDEFGQKYDDKILGSGIPWWHMQDTSVVMSNFNGIYDIHGGAKDLIYPHHESHLAQLEVLTSAPSPIRYWTHVGLVNIKGNKMSNSEGNSIRIRDVLKRYNSNTLRLYFFSQHYREPLTFSQSKLHKFENIDKTISNTMANVLSRRESNDGSKLLSKFMKYIEDDFNTPAALQLLTDTARSHNAVNDLKNMVNIFGLRY
ncbi:MAG TPA: class I tRNA ligase family protein [Nitrososphaeraceae archaeon]|nr:class I tRNA ligase family protein [Nitrososphaeraceae archaeon]